MQPEIEPGHRMWKRVLSGWVAGVTMLVVGCASQPEVKPLVKPAFPPPPAEARFIWERAIFSTADVRRDTEEDKLRRMLTGEQIVGEGLAKPFSVSAHKGRVFISDTVKRVVMAFDFPEQKHFEVGRKNPGRLNKPLGTDVDEDGRLFVVDGTQKKVFVYNRDGRFLMEMGEPQLFSRPSGVAVTPDGSRVFVVDTGGVSSDMHRIVVFDGNTGEYLYAFAERGAGEGQLNLPRDAAVGPDGLVYVVDGGNFRVQVFTQDGKFVRTFGEIGRRGGQFARPKFIDLDAEGRVYVSDAAFGNFQVFTTDGKLLLPVGNRKAVSEPASFMLPAGLDVDEDGRVLMVDQYFRKADIFRPARLPENTGYLSTPEQ